jgi:hypothetical protein
MGQIPIGAEARFGLIQIAAAGAIPEPVVAITKPSGSADADDKHPNAAGCFIGGPFYRFDFLGVTSGCPAGYSLEIKGVVTGKGAGGQQLGYKWTLEPSGGTSGAGTLDPETMNCASPKHIPPKEPGEGILTLTAMDGDNETKFKAYRKVKVFRDHLERDLATFRNYAEATDGFLAAFGKQAFPADVMWNCFTSVNHAYKGVKVGAPHMWVQEKWKDTEVQPLQAKWDDFNTLPAGTVVELVFYNLDAKRWESSHAHTCISGLHYTDKDGKDVAADAGMMWGANNQLSGCPRWAICTSKQWFEANVPNPDDWAVWKLRIYTRP